MFKGIKLGERDGVWVVMGLLLGHGWNLMVST